MPINFQPMDPFSADISYAYGALQQREQNRKYNLQEFEAVGQQQAREAATAQRWNEQDLQAAKQYQQAGQDQQDTILRAYLGNLNANTTLQRDRQQQQGQLELERSRAANRSDLMADRFGYRADLEDQRQGGQQDLQQQRFSLRQEQQMADLAAAHDAIDQDVADGYLTPEGAAQQRRMLAMRQAGIQPRGGQRPAQQGMIPNPFAPGGGQQQGQDFEQMFANLGGGWQRGDLPGTVQDEHGNMFQVGVDRHTGLPTYSPVRTAPAGGGRPSGPSVADISHIYDAIHRANPDMPEQEIQRRVQQRVEIASRIANRSQAAPHIQRQMEALDEAANGATPEQAQTLNQIRSSIHGGDHDTARRLWQANREILPEMPSGPPTPQERATSPDTVRDLGRLAQARQTINNPRVQAALEDTERQLRSGRTPTGPAAQIAAQAVSEAANQIASQRLPGLDQRLAAIVSILPEGSRERQAAQEAGTMLDAVGGDPMRLTPQQRERYEALKPSIAAGWRQASIRMLDPEPAQPAGDLGRVARAAEQFVASSRGNRPATTDDVAEIFGGVANPAATEESRRVNRLREITSRYPSQADLRRAPQRVQREFSELREWLAQRVPAAAVQPGQPGS